MTNNQHTPEQFIEALERWKMTPEERKLADAEKTGRVIGEKTGRVIGEIIGHLIVLFLYSTIIWLALVFLVGIQVAWLKVFGIYFIFNFIKNIIKKSIT